MKIELVIDGNKYAVATIKAGVAKGLPMHFTNPRESSYDLLVASLKSGGDENADETVADLDDGLFDGNSPYKQLVQVAMKVNGFKEVPKAEAETPAGSSEPIGDLSTDDSAVPLDGDTAT